MRAWISIVALAAAVAALGLWHYTRAPAREAPQAHAVSTMRAADVMRIRIERSAGAEGEQAPAASIELTRAGDGWRMTAPISARAEPLQVERLLAVLDARSVARYPATNLERYGLEDPRVAVTLNDQTFAHGAVNTVTREQYVLTRGAVYAIPLALRTALPKDADALLAKALFAPGETPVRFALEDFTAELQDGTWRFTPVGEEPGPDERNAWVAAWRQASAAEARRHDGRAPIAKLEVGLADGRTVTLGVLQRDPELVLLRVDEGVQYHFLAAAAKRLLAAPGAQQ